MEFTDFIKPELAILIPALYVVGMMIKDSERIKDKYIPAFLGGMGIALACLYVFASEGISGIGLFTALTQGLICAALAVYGNQLYKQTAKQE